MAKKRRNPKKKKIIKSGESFVVIDGEQLEIISKRDIGYGDGVEVETDDGDYILFPSSDDAGEAAREYWEELAANDPGEFRAIVGDENLIQWALGQYAGPGSQQTRSLEEWLDLWINNPEEHWASYNGQEEDVDAISSEAEEDIGFVPNVAYRTN